MTILLTGGTGKTSTHIIPYLLASSTPFLLTSRTPSPTPTHPTVKFDFIDPSTYSNPFESPHVTQDKPITAIYLIAPLAHSDPAGVVNEFITFAVEKHNVKRFVFLTGTTTVKGSAEGVGKVWSYLEEMKKEKEVEFTVLAATWFMENFSAWQHLSSIKTENKLYSACEDGLVPYISTEDIARVAFHALTAPSPFTIPESIQILGPRLLSMDDIAATLSKVLGREIQHVRLSPEERTKGYVGLGMPEYVAGFMTNLEVKTARGEEERVNSVVEDVTGKKPVEFEVWAERQKAVWG